MDRSFLSFLRCRSLSLCEGTGRIETEVATQQRQRLRGYSSSVQYAGQATISQYVLLQTRGSTQMAAKATVNDSWDVVPTRVKAAANYGSRLQARREPGWQSHQVSAVRYQSGRVWRLHIRGLCEVEQAACPSRVVLTEVPPSVLNPHSCPVDQT